MKSTLLFFVAALAAPTLHGQFVEERSHPELRTAILREFVFVPKPKPVDSENAPTAETTPSAADPDVIVLDKMVVYDHVLYRNLKTDMAKARPLAAQSHSKFGTGIHEKDFGRIRAYSVTILFIPILVGASW